MHELSIAQAIVESASAYVKKYRKEKVLKIQIQIGSLSGVVKEALEFVFPQACNATPLEGCQLDIVVIKAKIQCSTCGLSFECSEINMLCPACLSFETHIISGKDLTIQTIEMH